MEIRSNMVIFFLKSYSEGNKASFRKKKSHVNDASNSFSVLVLQKLLAGQRFLPFAFACISGSNMEALQTGNE